MFGTRHKKERVPPYNGQSTLYLSVGEILPLAWDTTRHATSKSHCKEKQKEQNPQEIAPFFEEI